MPHRHLNNETDVEAFCTFVRGLNLPATVEWTLGRDRSLDQNRLQFLWAREVAEQRGDVTPGDVRCEWKLHHGVPILREESTEFREVYDAALKPLPYELKLKAMRFVPVSSEMKVRQMVRYLDAIERECAERGMKITDPDPELATYQSRYRTNDNGKAAA